MLDKTTVKDSTTSIVEHIPSFLEYCRKERKLTDKSVENYENFINKFLDWLKQKKIEHLPPHDLTLTHIENYKESLLNGSLAKNTQNAYLTGLRILLSYFSEQGLSSLSPQSVRLEKSVMTGKSRSTKLESYIEQEALKELIQAPDTSTKTGLRDRIIIEVLIETGLKLNKLVLLNRSQVIKRKAERVQVEIQEEPTSYVVLPRSTSNLMKEYLNKRTDKRKALFINYRGRSPRSRLTGRSIERRIKRYVSQNDLSPLLTPEALRNIHKIRLLRKSSQLKIPYPFLTHKEKYIKDYAPESRKDHKDGSRTVSWHKTEKAIRKETLWLKENIDTISPDYQPESYLINCNLCLRRRIAVLILSGNVKATKLKLENKSLWNQVNYKDVEKVTTHGKQWHRRLMNVTTNHFKNKGYKVSIEPSLPHGRADLGVSSETTQVYIEIGTVSLFKLWYNLLTAKDTIFLIIPTKHYLIEFKT